MRYSNKMVILCRVLMLCLVLAGVENTYAQGKNTIEKLSVDSSNNKQRTSEKGELVKVTETVRVAYLPATHDTLLFIAKEKKFFEEYGLNVEIGEYSNSPKTLNALESGEVDIAIPGIASPLYRIASGAPLKIFGGEAWYSAGIVAKRDLMPKVGVEGKALLEPLKGKRIATITQSTGDAILRGKVIEFGLNNDIDIRDYSTPQKAINVLISGEVDAAMLWSPHMSLTEEKYKQTKIVVWTYQLMDHPCCRQVVTNKTYNNRREALIRYMSGIVKAKDFMAHSANDNKVLETVFNPAKKHIYNISDDILKKELFNINNDEEHKRTEVCPNNSPEQIEAYADMMAKAGLISEKSVSRIKESVDTDILTEAYQRVYYPKMTEEVARACAKSGLLSFDQLKELWDNIKRKNENKKQDSNQ